MFFKLSKPLRKTRRAYSLDPSLEFIEPRGLRQTQCMNYRKSPHSGYFIPLVVDDLALVYYLLLKLLGCAQVVLTYLAPDDYQVYIRDCAILLFSEILNDEIG